MAMQKKKYDRKPTKNYIKVHCISEFRTPTLLLVLLIYRGQRTQNNHCEAEFKDDFYPDP